jgi:hypothetical protein
MQSPKYGVGVHKSRGDAAIATMAVNQRQVTLPRFPNLLQNLAKNSVEHDFGWMVAVKVDFHLRPPELLGVARTSTASECHQEKNTRIIAVCSLLLRDGFNSDLVVDGLSQEVYSYD